MESIPQLPVSQPQEQEQSARKRLCNKQSAPQVLPPRPLGQDDQEPIALDIPECPQELTRLRKRLYNQLEKFRARCRKALDAKSKFSPYNSHLYRSSLKRLSDTAKNQLWSNGSWKVLTILRNCG